ncbi:MAG: UDP-N-acetylmuramate: L-alanyl-gamma-D-glutamyl-meso-diaminopimelate ligase [Flammeovirgaceae bacterium]|jgi:UDP-N-acetylmuramate: L-alanyl-gamma-D-glutamyl-meso-diaminopimelate ligase
MKIHFIAIGGSVMHNLAIALKKQGHEITGSDDLIFDPSKSKLEANGLLPENQGWSVENISADLDMVILGMHAKADNPELKKAQELGLKIHSYPSFIAEHSKNKQRIVIGGSHGKTTVTSIIINALQYSKRDFDYLIGATPHGFEENIRLSDGAPIIIIEGDEYLTSPLDKTPKFLHYDRHIGLVTGIAWDHINVYPDYDGYVEQFRKFMEGTPKAGTLIYNSTDKLVADIAQKGAIREDVFQYPYEAHKHKLKDGVTYLIDHNKNKVPIKLFGEHNLMNISGALEVCLKIGVTKEQFYASIQNFEGANMRLQFLKETNGNKVFRDFAHAPSKVTATVNAVKTQFGKHLLTACVELHTFSSLNKEFIPQYKDALKKADTAVVYFNPKAVEHKKLTPFSKEELIEAFNRKDLLVFDDSAKLETFLAEKAQTENVLLMSSGDFGGMKI